VTDLMVRPGLINLDFADVRAVMNEMGKAMMGTGEAEGEDRAVQAAEKAIANPLLDEISLKGARGVLINITGGYDLTLFELDEAANRIREEVDGRTPTSSWARTLDDNDGRPHAGRRRGDRHRPAAPGDVRPEVRARLMAAVNKTPVGEAPRPAPQGEPRSPAERKRFGINSLINRMTGQGSDAVAGNPGGAHYATERSEPDWDDQPEERADIPAFLRRQAN
jgi:cell division protein FtsZ